MERSDNNGNEMMMMHDGDVYDDDNNDDDWQINTRIMMYDISTTQTTVTMQYHQFCNKTMPLPTVVTTITFVLKSYSDESNNTTQQSATQT